MRISDWSSDVCSSDLDRTNANDGQRLVIGNEHAHWRFRRRFPGYRGRWRSIQDCHRGRRSAAPTARMRASCVLAVLRDGCQCSHRTSDTSRHLRADVAPAWVHRSEEHTSELQSLMRLSYAVFCLKKNNETITDQQIIQYT